MNLYTAALAIAALLTTATTPAFAAVSPGGKGVGVGVELGAPTNLNLKLMTGDNTGVVVGVGGGIWYDASLSLHVDFLWHPIAAPIGDDVTLSGYVGLGAWTSIGFEGSHFGFYSPYYKRLQPFSVGARVPLGVSLAIHPVPIEVFAEVVPAVAAFPGIGVFGQGGIGARLYF